MVTVVSCGRSDVLGTVVVSPVFNVEVSTCLNVVVVRTEVDFEVSADVEGDLPVVVVSVTVTVGLDVSAVAAAVTKGASVLASMMIPLPEGAGFFGGFIT